MNDGVCFGNVLINVVSPAVAGDRSIMKVPIAEMFHALDVAGFCNVRMETATSSGGMVFDPSDARAGIAITRTVGREYG